MMPKDGMGASRAAGLSDHEALQLWGRRALGAALAELRRRPGFSLTFAIPVVNSSMIRNFESGHAYLPLRKARPYARMLTVSKSVASFYVNPEALVLLIVALQEEEVLPVGAVDWKALHKEHADPLSAHVQQCILGELTRRGSDASGRSKQRNDFENLLEPLNPFQLQLVRDVASRLSDFGSNVVGDHAISHWERAHAEDLYNVRAIATCMESELQSEFVDSVSSMLVREKFGFLEYAIVGDHAQAQSVVRDFRQALGDRLTKRFGKSDTHKYLNKTRFWHVDPQALVPSTDADLDPDKIRSAWDALYLYERESRENLLVGVFRRARPFGAASDAVTLRNWGADHMNEVLPQYQIPHFEALFADLSKGARL